MQKSDHIADLTDRLARLHASETRTAGLTPVQVAALGYLARANRFSRKPSQLAEYLGTTRGTVSQLLKGLLKKGLVLEGRSTEDRRSVSFSLTREGRQALSAAEPFRAALASLPGDAQQRIARALETLLATLLSATESKSFGLCKTCHHHRQDADGAWCALLNERLAPPETEQICHEHRDAA